MRGDLVEDGDGWALVPHRIVGGFELEDILFLYTDGLMEGKNRAGDMYGKKRTRKLVETSLQRGPEQLIRTLMSDFKKHNEGKVLDDDVTLAAARILRVAEAASEANPEAAPEAPSEAEAPPTA